MRPPSAFAVPISSFVSPVTFPSSLPGDDPLIQVCVNADWLPYIAGALQQLLLQTTFEYVDDATVIAQQGIVLDIIRMFNAATAPECGSDMEFRQSDDCTLQVSSDGGATWSDIFNAQACALAAAETQIAAGIASGQIGSPFSAPGIGEGSPETCYEYDIEIAGNSSWQSPLALETGDVLTTTNVRGGWSDGSAPVIDHWYCGDGEDYLLGACAGGAGTGIGDPASSLNHMALIALIGATYYDAFNQAITVPGGQALVNVILQANDSVLSDNQGALSLHVQICKGGWTHVFDFTIANGSFTNWVATTWVSGQGWVGSRTGPGDYADHIKGPVVASRRVTHVEVTVTSTDPSGIDAVTSIFGRLSGGAVFQSDATTVDGVFTYTWDGDATIDQVWFAANGGDTSTGQVITRVSITGSGSDPY